MFDTVEKNLASLISICDIHGRNFFKGICHVCWKYGLGVNWKYTAAKQIVRQYDRQTNNYGGKICMLKGLLA